MQTFLYTCMKTKKKNNLEIHGAISMVWGVLNAKYTKISVNSRK